MLVTLRFVMPILLLCSLFFSSFAYSTSVIRGPYLQMGTDKTMTVRWRTDTRTDSVVRFGSSSDNLNQTVTVSSPDTEHEVTVTGLSPLTQYYYSVGSSDETVAGGDSSYRFTTSPSADNSTPTRVLLFGDSGTESDDADAVYKAYLNYPGAENTNLWIMLGDNAYNDGTDSNYQNALFKVYPELLRRTPLWSTLGNHDGHSADSNSESGPYYDIFTFPRNAEAGGLASGTEAYYSFDYGNIHFVCLDSYGTDRSAGGAMMSWLENDLSVNNKKWLIAFWHHPAYSKGSHDSDSEDELVEMRQNALPILEKYGVDLVFSGHSHSYERSFLLDSHYGTSDTLNSSHLINNGDGRENGDGAYQKANQANAGAVYTVAGASGHATGGDLNHPAMFSSLNLVGSVVLDITNDRIDAKYLGSDGSVTDYYSVIKGQNFTTFTSTPTDVETTPTVDDKPDNLENAATVNEPDTSTRQRGVSLNGEGTYVASDDPNKNFASSNAILADGADDNNGELVGLIKWDVNNLPAGISVNDAKIEVEVFDTSSDEYNLYKGNIAWNENSATWNTTSPYSNRGEKIGSFNPSSTGTQVVNLNQAGKTLVQSWINGAANNGVFMMSGGTSEDGVDMHSGATNQAPKLIINQGDSSGTTQHVTTSESTPVSNDSGSSSQRGAFLSSEDTYVASDVPDKNYGSSKAILADGFDDSNGELVSLIKWDVSNFSSGTSVNDAKIELEVFDSSSDEYILYKGNVAWNKSNATWNTTSPYSNRGEKIGSFTPSSTGTHAVNLNQAGKTLVQSWINGAANHGVFIMSGGTSEDGVDMHSGATNQAPKLIINQGDSSGTTTTQHVATSESTPVSNESGSSSQRGDFLSSEDTYVASDVPDKNYGSSKVILADGSDDSNGELVSLVKWDVSNFSSGTSVNDAKIELEVFDSSSDEYILYKGNVAWNKSNATWNTTSPYSNRGEKIGSFTPSNTGTQTVYLNDAGKSLVQSWINGGAANNGVIMMSGGTYDDGVDIHSSVTNTPPKLIINTNGNPSVTTSTAPPQASAPSGTREAGTVELQAGQNGFNGVQDAFITEGEPDKNYGSDHSILVDGYDDARKELVGLMHWDISSIPSRARITGASLTLHVHDASDEEHALREMKKTWSEGNSTWNNVQPRANRGTTLGSFTPSSIGSHKVNFNADGIALIQSWVNGASNTGFTIENSAMYYGSDGADIRASEYETKSQRPKLTITYE